MLLNILVLVSGFILGILSGKKYWAKGYTSYSEAIDLLVSIRAALKDSKITKDEMRTVLKEADEFAETVIDATR